MFVAANGRACRVVDTAAEVEAAGMVLFDTTWARGRGWALSQALSALSYYTLETNPVLVRESRRWMVDVLAE